MLSIPAKLSDAPFVTTLYTSSNLLFLKKNLEASALNRHSYISMPVISWVLTGNQRIETYDGEEQAVREGHLSIYRKGIYTINDLVSSSKGFQAYLIFLNQRFLKELLQEHPQKSSTRAEPTPMLEIPCPELVAHFFLQFEIQLQLLNQVDPAWIQVKLQELFLLFKQGPEAASIFQFLHSLDQKKNRNIRQLMEAHFDKPLTIPDYAYLSGRSESTFRREFKQRFGLPPNQWLIRKRLEKAKELLQEPDYPVSSVALQVGYENVSHFIQTFKSHFQQTPSAFQQAASG